MTENLDTDKRSFGLIDDALDDLTASTKYWWLMLVAGIAWIVVSILILRFDYGTIAAIAILAGVFCLGAAANEIVVSTLTPSKGWRILHWLLAVLFVVVGIAAFVHPGDTFVGLAAVMSFYFVFRGCFDIATAFTAAHRTGWWVLLLVGLAEIVIGFWAAGSWNVSVTLLVSWVAAGALVHGVGQISAAFLTRTVGKGASAVENRRTERMVA
jgi:uncharacterized membrane protein HdeD (DUF308 family)